LQINNLILFQKEIVKFKEPNLLFQNHQISKIDNAMEGIQRLGPFDYNNNERNFDKIQIILLGNDNEQNLDKLLKLLSYLKNGLNNFKGFPNMFRIEELIIPQEKSEIIFYDGNNDKDIINELNDFYNQSNCPRNQINFIIGFGKDHRAIESTDNYYNLKKICLKLGYPIQYISSFSTDSYSGVLNKINDTKYLKYILWNISVSIYSKSGGIPWLLKNPNNVDITIGLRFARHKDKGYSTGFVSVFNKYGKYLGMYSDTFPDEDYDLTNKDFKFFSEGMIVPTILIKRIIEDSITHFNINNKNKIEKISIQKIGKFGKEELIGFNEELKNQGIDKYSLIEIYNNDIQRFFNLNNENYNIDRGICLPFNESSGFLCTTGNYSYHIHETSKQRFHFLGTPKPLKVNLKVNHNCYRDFTDVCLDIFTLTGLHYQTVIHNEIRLPAPLLFAHKIAKFSKFGIKPHDNLKNTPWFL